MAALDFPPGSTVGQQFSAANGVVYTWNGTLWLANAGSGAVTVSDTPPSNPVANQLWFNSLLGSTFIYYNDGNTTQWVPASPNMNVPTSPGGDFMATHSSVFPVPTTIAPLILNTVKTGNSGGWYSTTTGRWTPPAGRYHVTATLTQAYSTVACSFNVAIYKNGVYFASAGDTTATASYYASPTIDALVDANGSDYFEMWGSGSGGSTVCVGWFLAFPISGTKGPPGDYPSGLKLYDEQVLSSANTSITVTCPVNAKVVEIHFDLGTNLGANDGLLFYLMQGATPNTAANYNMQSLRGTGSTPSSAVYFNLTSWSFASGIYWSGVVRCIQTATTLPYPMLNGQLYIPQSGGTRSVEVWGGDHATALRNTVTGFRFASSSSTLAIGSTVRVMVVI